MYYPSVMVVGHGCHGLRSTINMTLSSKKYSFEVVVMMVL